MKKMKAMSSKQRRIAAGHMGDYRRLDKLPQVGVVVFGGGLNVLAALDTARAKGFHVGYQTDTYATLNR